MTVLANFLHGLQAHVTNCTGRVGTLASAHQTILRDKPMCDIIRTQKHGGQMPLSAKSVHHVFPNQNRRYASTLGVANPVTCVRNGLATHRSPRQLWPSSPASSASPAVFTAASAEVVWGKARSKATSSNSLSLSLYINIYIYIYIHEYN